MEDNFLNTQIKVTQVKTMACEVRNTLVGING